MPYSIGSRTVTTPLVDSDQLKAHLCLLRAFKGLRTIVEADPRASPQTSPNRTWPTLAQELNPSRRWRWFLHLAVDRFHAWLRCTLPPSDFSTWVREGLPPIDVLMVWHAYLLNPMWYAEDRDRLRILAPLRSLDHNWLVKVISFISDICAYEAPQSRKEAWERETGMAFDPIVAAANAKTRTIHCPRCIEPLEVPYLTAGGSGYAQTNFVARCPSCALGGISKEGLGVLKFAQDAVLDPKNRADSGKHRLGCYQAGTLRTVLRKDDTDAAYNVKRRLLNALAPSRVAKSVSRNSLVVHITNSSMRSATRLASQIGHVFPSGPDRVMSAYTDDRPFSVELVGAIIRQCSFIDKMHEFGWTNPKHFDSKDGRAVLVNVVSRYHAFLDLLSTCPRSLLVPTLDIDLAWHTHQMLGTMYHSDCLRYFGRYIDHDDKIEEYRIRAAFDDTCLAWETRFRMPYCYCGCPLPDATFGSLVSRMKRKLSGGGASAMVPPQTPDACSATHASEHNVVFTTGNVSTYFKLEVRRRRQRDERAAHDGKMDPETVRRGARHYAAFMPPRGAREDIRIQETPVSYAFPQPTISLRSNISAEATQIRASCNPPSWTIFSALSVRTDELKTHLRLLHAFKQLRNTVEADPRAGPETAPGWMWPVLARQLDAPRRWTWFLELAVDRFQMWLQCTKPCSDFSIWVQDELPPLDVLMVWHAYLLNPMWYAEDLDRLKILAPLRTLDPNWFLWAIGTIGDISTYKPPESRKVEWRRLTGKAFDPLVAAGDTITREIYCPNCIKPLRVPYLTADGKGYAQAKFATKCSSCLFDDISRESLAVLKFARDVALDPYNPEDFVEHGLGCYQAGTLRTTLNPRDTVMASSVKTQLRAELSPPGVPNSRYGDDFAAEIARSSGWSMVTLANRTKPALKQFRPNHIMSAYTDDRPFSVELVGAMTRQCSFIDKMHHFGWTVPGCFDSEEDQIVLKHAIARYDAFLGLFTRNSKSLFVPTLDIDLAWHTHQMLGEAYHSKCFSGLGRFVHHDDKIEQSQLATAFDNTCRVWESRYGVRYSHCGCPTPHANNLSPPVGSRLAPPNRPDGLAATHPSEHNALFPGKPRTIGDARMQRIREGEMRKRSEQALRAGRTDTEAPVHDAAFASPQPAVELDIRFLRPVSFRARPPVHTGTSGTSSRLSEAKKMILKEGKDVLKDIAEDLAGSDDGCDGGCGGGGCGGGGCGGGCGGN